MRRLLVPLLVAPLLGVAGLETFVSKDWGVSVRYPADLVASAAFKANYFDRGAWRVSYAADTGPGTRILGLSLPDLKATDAGGESAATAELRIAVGHTEPATAIPLYAASVRGTKASLFVVDGDVAHKRTVLVKGELNGMLYCEPDLKPGALVVSEGRALLSDNDKVSANASEQAVATPKLIHAHGRLANLNVEALKVGRGRSA